MAKAPVGFTCPDIDSVISSIKEMFREFDRFRDSAISTLEDLRKDNQKLREYGEEMEERVKELEEEIAVLEDQVNTTTP